MRRSGIAPGMNFLRPGIPTVLLNNPKQSSAQPPKGGVTQPPSKNAPTFYNMNNSRSNASDTVNALDATNVLDTNNVLHTDKAINIDKTFNAGDYLSVQNDSFAIDDNAITYIPLPNKKIISNFTDKSLDAPEIPADTFYVIPKDGLYLISYSINVQMIQPISFTSMIGEYDEEGKGSSDVAESTYILCASKPCNNITTAHSSISTLCRLTKDKFIGVIVIPQTSPIYIDTINLTILRVAD